MSFVSDFACRLLADSLSRKIIDWRKVEVTGLEYIKNDVGIPIFERRDYAELAGGLADSSVSVGVVGKVVRLVVDHDVFMDPFVLLLIFEEKDSWIQSERLYLKPDAQGQGIVTRIVAMLVRAAARLGFSEIRGNALMNQTGPQTLPHNGAYTFGRLGFDGDLEAEHLQALPSKYVECQNLSDVLSTSEGRRVWKEHGKPLRVKFQLSHDSNSTSILNGYLQEKKIRLP